MYVVKNRTLNSYEKKSLHSESENKYKMCTILPLIISIIKNNLLIIYTLINIYI